jgi:hypothetical protein
MPAILAIAYHSLVGSSGPVSKLLSDIACQGFPGHWPGADSAFEYAVVGQDLDIMAQGGVACGGVGAGLSRGGGYRGWKPLLRGRRDWFKYEVPVGCGEEWQWLRGIYP